MGFFRASLILFIADSCGIPDPFRVVLHFAGQRLYFFSIARKRRYVMSLDQSISRLEKRLEDLRQQYLDSSASVVARDERRRLEARIAELRHEEAQSWSRSDWLSMIEKLLDDIGRYVDRLVTRH
jgi:hypothetical protein